MEHAVLILAIVGGLATILGLFGLNQGISNSGAGKTGGASPVLIALIFALVIFAVGIAAFLHKKDNGTLAKKMVGRDWRRWAAECPKWYRLAFRRFPWLRATAAVVLTFASLIVIRLLFHKSLPVLESVAEGVVLIGIGYPALQWFTRWSDIEKESKK